MSTSLVDKGQMSENEVVKIASACLEEKVVGIAPIGRGGNSRVYHLTTAHCPYVVKFYFQHPSDSRDRLGTEYKSLSFLHEQAIRMVPRPVAISREHSCAFYGFIEGTAMSHDISRKDIEGAVEFLGILNNLTGKAREADFPAASEAFFCGQDIVKGLRGRLKRFYFEDGPEYLALREYLHHEFMPLLDTVDTWSQGYFAKQGLSWDKELPAEYRTLSPSDFGFHNALRTGNGSIVFLDFEYFGWDDPAKLVSDFLWHPAMSLPEGLKKHFALRMSTIFDKDAQFKARLKGVFPLFGLKWCLIFLNEFIATDLQRRNFAKSHTKDKTAIKLEQLAKAKDMTQKIKRSYKDFPYES